MAASRRAGTGPRRSTNAAGGERPVLERVSARRRQSGIKTLAIDVGAGGVKAGLLTQTGRLLGERERIRTPSPPLPGAVMDVVVELAGRFARFDRVSVGFPGIVRHGIVVEAPTLGPEWADFRLTHVLEARLNKPVRAANDADVQGFGVISGRGTELVVTLGTGVGTSLYVDGVLVPNVEAGRRKLAGAQLEKAGATKWNRRVAKAVTKLDRMFHCDRLYLGGGNARHVRIDALPPHVTIVSNLNGLVGGIALWRDRPARRADEPGSVRRRGPVG